MSWESYLLAGTILFCIGYGATMFLDFRPPMHLSPWNRALRELSRIARRRRS